MKTNQRNTEATQRMHQLVCQCGCVGLYRSLLSVLLMLMMMLNGVAVVKMMVVCWLMLLMRRQKCCW